MSKIAVVGKAVRIGRFEVARKAVAVGSTGIRVALDRGFSKGSRRARRGHKRVVRKWNHWLVATDGTRTERFRVSPLLNGVDLATLWEARKQARARAEQAARERQRAIETSRIAHERQFSW